MSYRQAFGQFYTRNFERRPWLTLAVTNGFLGLVADSVAQSFERLSHRQNQTRLASSDPQQPSWDWARNARFLVFNASVAPLMAEWNRFLEFRFPLRPALVGSAAKEAGKVSAKALAKRVAFDQIVFAPFGLALFVGAMGFMERGSWQGTKEKYSEVRLILPTRPTPVHPLLRSTHAIPPATGRNRISYLPLTDIPQMYSSALLANWQVWPLVQLVNFRFMPLKYRVPFVSSVGILWNIGLSLLSQATTTQHHLQQAASDKSQALAQKA
ncbi:hypothetical protein ACQY0O_001006 [Thecaphora frezii]